MSGPQVQHEEVSSTIREPGDDLRAHMASHTPRKFLLVKPGEYFDIQVAVLAYDIC